MSRIRRRTVSESEQTQYTPKGMWAIICRELLSDAGQLTGGGISEHMPLDSRTLGNSRSLLGTCAPYCHSVGFWIIFFITLTCCTLEGWANYHYLSKTRCYFFLSWLKAVMTVCILQIVLRKFSMSFKTRFSNARKKFLSLWPLMLLHSLTVYIQAMDSLKVSRNASGSEFYQLQIVLSMPALIACLSAFSVMSTPGYLYITVLCCSGLQLMLLCRDPEFDFSFVTSLYSFIFVAIKGSYIVVLTGDLHQEAILQLTYYLNLGLCFSHPLALIARGEVDLLITELLSLQDLMELITQAFCMATFGVIQMAVSFFMLKVTDPLVFLYVVNLQWFPMTLIQAFIYKRDFMVSSFRALWILPFIMISVLVREPWTASSSTRGESTSDNQIRIHTK